MTVNHVLLETIQLTANTASVIFDNIPQTGYTDLIIKVSARTVRSSEEDGLYMVLNNLNSSGFRNLETNGTSVSSVSTASYGNNWVTRVNGGTSTANIFGNAEIYILDYTSNKQKSISVDGVIENNATLSYTNLTSSLWPYTAPVTSISFGCNANFAIGCTFSLYGIAALDTTPTVGPKAIGGNIIATDGTFWYHAFVSSGTFIPQNALNAKIMVVGGGAGGGAHIAGGGGAGAINDFTSTYSLTSGTNYICTVGAGGGGNTGTAKGSPGINSTFAGTGFTTITANGGGYGGGNDVFPGGPGGSGGGAAASGGGAAGGTASGPNTFAGGSGWYGPYPIYSAGGGGGATAAGGNGSTTASVGGNGGQGMLLSSIDSNLTTVLPNAFSNMTRVSSGGGGCGQNPAGGAQTGGTGGAGGGNGGFGTTNATNATSYGSGGGGGNWSDAGGGATGDGGNGYQGIVIIRYAI